MDATEWAKRLARLGEYRGPDVPEDKVLVSLSVVEVRQLARLLDARVAELKAWEQYDQVSSLAGRLEAWKQLCEYREARRRVEEG